MTADAALCNRLRNHAWALFHRGTAAVEAELAQWYETNEDATIDEQLWAEGRIRGKFVDEGNRLLAQIQALRSP